MVIFENKSTNLNKISKALEDNLNIIPSDSRLKTITDKIADSRYRIKDLSTISNVTRAYSMYRVDNKVFMLPITAFVAAGVNVFDTNTNELLTSIVTGSNVVSVGITHDNDYIYISKTVETITDKKYRDVYVRKYNRCTLDFISESPILYTGVSGVSITNSTNIFGITENGEYLYLACIQIMQTVGDFHKIRKIKKTDFSQVAEITWEIPLNIIKHENGFFVAGTNNKLSSDTKYRRIDFLDWDLNIIQTFPQTTLTTQNFRYGFYKDDFLYVCNDSGVLVKYQISTNTIAAETQISEIAGIHNIMLIDDNYILLQTNKAEIMLYDLALNFIKMWDFYNTTTAGGYVISDKNNTIWTQSASQPTTIYKKQFIDLTKDIT